MEDACDTTKRDVFCSHHKLWEAWDRNAELVEEMDSERPEQRGGHVRKEFFQVSTDTLEVKQAEVTKYDVGYDRHTQQLPLDITLGNRAAKANSECLKPWQE